MQYTKSWLSEEDSNFGKGGRKEKMITSSNWMDSVTVAVSAPLKDLNDQVKDRLQWRKSIHVVAKN